MIQFLINLIWIIVLVCVILFICFISLKIFAHIKYKWRAELPFYIIGFTTRAKPNGIYTVGFKFNDNYYRLKKYAYTKQDIDNDTSNIIKNILIDSNNYNTIEDLIKASYHISNDRVYDTKRIKTAPEWATYICKNEIIQHKK